MIFEMIVFGGVLFWLIAGALILLAIACINWDNGIAAGAWLTLAVAVTVLFTDAPIGRWFSEHGSTALLAVPAYLFAGAAWAIVKWQFFVLRIRRWCERWMEKNPGKSRNNLETAAGYEFIQDGNCYLALPPDPKEFGSRIGRWIGYWPFSIVADVIGDGLAKLIETVRGGLSGAMRALSGRAFKDFEAPPADKD